jgi:hypothetical protein
MARITLDEAKAEQTRLATEFQRLGRQIEEAQQRRAELDRRYVHLDGVIEALSPEEDDDGPVELSAVEP